jgi:hypothetical protein
MTHFFTKYSKLLLEAEENLSYQLDKAEYSQFKREMSEGLSVFSKNYPEAEDISLEEKSFSQIFVRILFQNSDVLEVHFMVDPNLSLIYTSVEGDNASIAAGIVKPNTPNVDLFQIVDKVIRAYRHSFASRR